MQELYKKCSKCKVNKNYAEFYIRPNGSPYSQCNICKKQSAQQWYENDMKNITKYQIDEKQCPECKIIKPKDKFYVLKKNGQMSTYCIDCENKKYNHIDPARKATKQKWRENHKDHIKQYNIEYHHQKRKKNIQYRINQALRSSLHRTLNKKTENTYDYIGCSSDFLENWLNFLFDKKMNWDNYGEYWEIDHVKPCASFDLTNKEEQKICYHWTNLRPLVCQENRSKQDKIIELEITKQKLNVLFFNRQHVQIAGTS